MDERRSPLLPLDAKWADALLAAAIAVVQVTSAAITGRQSGEPSLQWWGIALLVASAVPLVWRRRSPLVITAVVGVFTAAYGIAEQPDPLLQIPALVGLYTIAMRCSRRTTLLVAVIGALSSVVVIFAAGDSGIDDYFSAYLSVAAALVLGDRQRIKAEHLLAVEEHAAELEQRRLVDAARAVADERARIARELHDVVAHHVSMMVVQAEAGAATTSDLDARVVDRFDGIADTGRDALTELRRLLGVLRDDDAADLSPQPSLDQLPALVDQVRRAGLPVELRTEGAARPLSDGVGLTAYRIVQEALTNVTRHGGGVPTTVTVRYGPADLELAVVDVGGPPRSGAAARTDGTGVGLIGIRERVAMCGGELRVGPLAGGGFEVAARLPLGG